MNIIIPFRTESDGIASPGAHLMNGCVDQELLDRDARHFLVKRTLFGPAAE